MNVTGNLVGEVLKEVRGNNTQQQFSFDLGVARETLSKYENGRTKLPADISRNLMKKYDDPRLAMAIQYEYTRTGPVLLDGPNVDLHRCSVKEKLKEEGHECLSAVDQTNLTKPAHALNMTEIEDIRYSIEETLEFMTAAANYVVVATQHINESYLGAWSSHYDDLECKGFKTRGAR